MKRALKNLWFAASARPERIENSGGFSFWPAAYVAMVAAMLSSDLAYLLVLPVGAAVTAALLPKHIFNAIDHEKLVIASVGAPLPAILLAYLDMSILLVLLLVYVGFLTVGLVLIEGVTAGPLPESGLTPDADALRRMRSTSSSPVFVEMGPSMGKLYGVDIPAWFRDDQGRTHEYITSHTGSSPPSLAEGESFVAPGLIYRLVTAEADQISGMKPEN